MNETGSVGWRYLPLLVLAAGLITAYASGAFNYLDPTTFAAKDAMLRRYVADHFVVTLALFVVVYIITTAISFPGATVLTLIGGFLFETWLGGSATIIGATIGALLVFFAVRISLGQSLRRGAAAQDRKTQTLVARIERNSLGYLLALRLFPFAPFWLVNIAAGLAAIRTRTYLTATLIGIAPASLIYSALGAAVRHQAAREEGFTFTALLAPSIWVPLLVLSVLSFLATMLPRMGHSSGDANP